MRTPNWALVLTWAYSFTVNLAPFVKLLETFSKKKLKKSCQKVWQILPCSNPLFFHLMLPRHTVPPNFFSVLSFRDYQFGLKLPKGENNTHLNLYKKVSDTCLGFSTCVTDIKLHKWHHLNKTQECWWSVATIWSKYQNKHSPPLYIATKKCKKTLTLLLILSKRWGK